MVTAEAPSRHQPQARAEQAVDSNSPVVVKDGKIWVDETRVNDLQGKIIRLTLIGGGALFVTISVIDGIVKILR